MIDMRIGLGGSGWSIDSKSTVTVPSGASGTLINIQAPVGKLIKITTLSSSSSATNESDISLSKDGVLLKSGILSSYSLGSIQVGHIFVSDTYSYTSVSATGLASHFKYIYCNSFTVTKTSGSLSNGVGVTYEVGEFK